MVGEACKDPIVWFTVVAPLNNDHLGDRRKWPVWKGGRCADIGV